MAIFSFNSHLVRRSQNQSAVHTAAYCRGNKMYENRTCTTTSRLSTSEILYSKIVFCKNAPGWVHELLATQQNEGNLASERLWNKVVDFEKRKDSQEAYKHFCALPNELDINQVRNLADEIANMVASYGTIVDYSIHHRSGNCYMYMLETMRYLTKEGFGLKNSQLSRGMLFSNNKASLDSRIWKIREQAASIINKHLTMHGIKSRVDHRTLKEQDSNLKPLIRIGSTSVRAAEKGIITKRLLKNENIKKENLNILHNNVNSILQNLSRDLGVFSCQDIAKNIIKYIPMEEVIKNNLQISQNSRTEISNKIINIIDNIKNNFVEISNLEAVDISSFAKNKFAKIFNSIMCSKELIYLGVGDDGLELYTTNSCFKEENKVIEVLNKYASSTKLCLDANIVEKYIHSNDLKLTKEQIQDAKSLISKKDIICLTYEKSGVIKDILKTCAKIWESENFSATGVAVSNVAANKLYTYGLKKVISISELLRYSFKDKRYADHKNIFIINESSLINNSDISRALLGCHKFGSKLILLDEGSLSKEVKTNSIFKAIQTSVPNVIVPNSYDGKYAWFRKVYEELVSGDLKKVLKEFARHKKINCLDSDKEVKKALIDEWASDYVCGNDKIILSDVQEDVYELNYAVRELLLNMDFVKDSKHLTMYVRKNNKTVISNIQLGLNEKIVFKKQAVINGIKISKHQRGEIKKIVVNEQNKIKKITVKLDGAAKCLDILASDMWNNKLELAYGYAIKTSRNSIPDSNDVFYYIGERCNKHIIRFLLSKYETSLRFYISEEKTGGQEAFYDKISKEPMNDATLGFPVNFSLTHGLELENLSGIKEYFVDKVINSSIESKIFVAKRLSFETSRHTKTDQISGHLGYKDKSLFTSEGLIEQYIDINKEYSRSWINLVEYSRTQSCWDAINSSIDFSLIKQSQEYKQIIEISKNRDKIIESIHIDLDKYKLSLDYYGLGKELTEFQEKNSRFFYAVCKYKQGRNKLKNAKILSEILSCNPSYCIKLDIANIKPNILRQHVREYDRQSYLQNLTGDPLNHFKLIEMYDLALNKFEELSESHKRQFNTPSSKENLPIVLNNEQNNKLEKALEEQSLLCASYAYEIYKTANKSVGLNFYEFSNSDEIDRLKLIYNKEQEAISQNDSVLKSLESRIDYLNEREAKLLEDASIYECYVNILEYKRTKKDEVASKIRASLKKNYQRNYDLAKFHGIDWNELITCGERYDKAKIYQRLTIEQRICYDKVGRYLELDRLEGIQLVNSDEIKEKIQLAREIISSIEDYHLALDFYQIAHASEGLNFAEHEIKAFNKLMNNSNNVS